MNAHDTDQVLSAAVYAAVARAYDNERSIEDAADEILDAIEPYKQRIAELEAQLEAIGAGGVSGQRITSQRRGEPYNPRKPTEEEWSRLTENGRKAWGGPVKAPSKLSNAEIMSLAYDVGAMPEQMTDGSLLRFARALLARYGQPVEPEGWQLVPKEPTKEMLAATSWPNCAGTDYRHMLAAAPKFGEEE